MKPKNMTMNLKPSLLKNTLDGSWKQCHFCLKSPFESGLC